MSLPGSKEFDDLFNSPEFIKKCLAVIHRFVDDDDDANGVLTDTYIELKKKNLDHAIILEAFIMDAMKYNAMAFNKKLKRRPEKPSDKLKEFPAKNLAPVKMRYEEIKKAIRLYRSEEDYILFELISQGYGNREIIELMNVTEEAVRIRKFRLFKWIKEHFNGK